MTTFSRPRLRIHVAIAFAFAVVVLAGCGDSKNDGAAPASRNAQDVSFVEDMIPHHGQAVEMTKLAETRASHDRVKALALQIQAAQQPEINTMNAFLTKWGKPTVDASAPSGGHASHGKTMAGMLSADEMKKLEAASGPAFDALFLELMIEHHKGAIDMAKTEAEKGQDAETKTLANNIARSQQEEITEMENLLKTV